MKYICCLFLLIVSSWLSVYSVLVTCTIFPTIAGKKVYLFGDNHTSVCKQEDLEQLYAFQHCVQQQVAISGSTTHIYCEMPCNMYYRMNKDPKVTASLVSYIKTLSDTSGALAAQDIETRGPAVAADFLLTRIAMLKYTLEDLLFTTNGTTISLATLTFDDILKHADTLEQQVKVQHIVIFGNHYTDIVKIDCVISKENRQELQQQLQALGLEPASLVLAVSRLLVDQDKLEQRQQLLQTVHNIIDPLFRLALMHKIYAAQAEKVVVVAGYLHTNVLSYYFTKLGFAGQSFGSSMCSQDTPIPLDIKHCTFLTS